MREAATLEVDVTVRRREFDVEAALAVGSGERLALFGPSGAGKTTILETIAGLTAVARGKVLVDGSPVVVAGRGATTAPRHRGVALVRQPSSLFDHLSVAENVSYGARRPDLRQGVPDLLARLGLSDLAGARAATLSGGQRQRVALGRALSTGFRVLLLDEPLSAVDGPSKAQLRDLAAETCRRRQAAALLVTHDLAEAQAFGERLAIIDSGRVLQIGDSHELVLRPATRRVAELVGYEGFVRAGDDRRWYAIHPEQVRLGSWPAGIELAGRVESVRAHGPRYECSVLLESGGRFTARLDAAVVPGTAATFTAVDPPVVAT